MTCISDFSASHDDLYLSHEKCAYACISIHKLLIKYAHRSQFLIINDISTYRTRRKSEQSLNKRIIAMSATKQLVLSRRSASGRINGGIITASSGLSVTYSTVTLVERYNYRKGEKPRFQRDSQTHARIEIAQNTLMKQTAQSRDKGRMKGRLYFIIRSNDCQYQQGDAARRAGAVLWKSRRKSRSWFSSWDRITFDLSDLRYLAR